MTSLSAGSVEVLWLDGADSADIGGDLGDIARSAIPTIGGLPLLGSPDLVQPVVGVTHAATVARALYDGALRGVDASSETGWLLIADKATATAALLPVRLRSGEQFGLAARVPLQDRVTVAAPWVPRRGDVARRITSAVEIPDAGDVNVTVVAGDQIWAALTSDGSVGGQARTAGLTTIDAAPGAGQQQVAIGGSRPTGWILAGTTAAYGGAIPAAADIEAGPHLGALPPSTGVAGPLVQLAITIDGAQLILGGVHGLAGITWQRPEDQSSGIAQGGYGASDRLDLRRGLISWGCLDTATTHAPLWMRGGRNVRVHLWPQGRITGEPVLSIGGALQERWSATRGAARRFNLAVASSGPPTIGLVAAIAPVAPDSDAC